MADPPAARICARLPDMLQFDVVLSLIGICAGVAVLASMLTAQRPGVWTTVFLISTVLTCLTGFILPHEHVLPSDVVGVIVLVALALAIVALYGRHLVGAWRWIYVVTAVLALYLNIFVGVVQAFDKVPMLSRLAPTQSETPFLGAQLLVLLLFIGLGALAVLWFHPPALDRGGTQRVKR